LRLNFVQVASAEPMHSRFILSKFEGLLDLGTITLGHSSSTPIPSNHLSLEALHFGFLDSIEEKFLYQRQVIICFSLILSIVILSSIEIEVSGLWLK